jgi:signal transduction histidine kinase/ligand-binding sensor domain-containing protein/DNA-binding response OmpR family regulator
MFLFSCSLKEEDATHSTYTPKVVPAHGYVVPKDSMADPKIIPVDEGKLTKIPVGDPTVVPAHSNIHPAGRPKVILAGIPRVVTIGQDTFTLPVTVPAIYNQIKGSIPEVVIAKDPTIIDPNPQSFSSFGKLQGLKDGAIECMLEDRNGNLWLSTRNGGISKYDGKSFTHFTLNEEFFNHVTSMLEDKNGNVWFGSVHGVSKYDGRSFTHFTEKEGLVDNNVKSMLEDKSGNLWFGTGAGVSQLSQDGKTFTHFTRKEGLIHNDVRSLLEDKNGNLWFGTAGGGVCRLNKERKTFTHFTEKEGLSNNYVTSIAEDKSGNLWFSNPNSGVTKLSQDWKSFAHFTKNEGLINDVVRTIFVDKSANIWFGHLDGGASRLSQDEKSFTHFTTREGLIDYDVRSILEDKSGNLWFGTYLGVSKDNGRSFNHFTHTEGLSNNAVWSILEDKKSNLWFGHDTGGVSRLSADGKSVARFTKKEGLGGMMVWAMLEDKNGNLWMGTIDGGVTQLSQDGKYFTHFTTKDGLCADGILSILEDESGNLWFGTVRGGVSRLSSDRKSFTNFTREQGLINNFVSAIVEDKNGNIWFGTSGGASRLSQDGTITNFTVKEGLSANIIWAMQEDRSGNLWFGHQSGGVSRLSSDEKLFTHFTENEGLVNNTVSSILEDKRGNLWIGTQFGLSKFSKEKLAEISRTGELTAMNNGSILFKNFTYEDGFLGIGCLANSIYEDRNGTIWIGTNDRLTAYHPEGDVADTIAPTIQLTNFELFGENINWLQLENKEDTSFVLSNGVSMSDFEFDGVSKWYFLPENLRLAHHNNNVTFNFIGITQKNPQKVRYQYKLEGDDDHWSAITTRSDAPYGNLSPGAYTFKVKAMNSEGHWSEEFHYAFIIRPPWWKTWWAYTLYGLTIIGVVLSWRNYEINRLKLKHRAEHLSELDTLKTRFFANISHEFRTPITLILGPLKELYNKANSDDQKTALGTMMRNGQRLLRLVNQLLDLSKLEAGKMTLQASRTDLVQFLREVTSSYESLATDKKIKFFYYPEPQELTIYLDQEKIEKVVHNILSNAFKFTKENGEVILYLKVDHNQQAVIIVRDTGIGIPENQLNHVFDRFYQVDNSQTWSYEGSGIGMALAKELIELHHGTISVESKAGKGSTFTVRLPLDKEYLRTEEIIESGEGKNEERISSDIIFEGARHETSGVSEAVTGTHPVLLIVEDNTDMRNYLAKTLSDSYQIVEAVNGKEGVQKAAEFLPDLIISDIMMPEMDGYKLCELIKTKEMTSHIAVILLTAKADQQSRLTGLEHRADDYLLKPFNTEELKLIVRNRIDTRRKMQEKFSREITLEPAQISVSSLDEKFLQRVMTLIEAHMEDEHFSIEDFSQEAGYSRMQFYRKIKALTGQTPSQFVRTFRLKRAAQFLSRKSDNVTQIAYSVGFRSLAYFNKCFKEQFGVTPGQFSETDHSNPKSWE